MINEWERLRDSTLRTDITNIQFHNEMERKGYKLRPPTPEEMLNIGTIANISGVYELVKI